MRDIVDEVYVDDSIYEYVAKIAENTTQQFHRFVLDIVFKKVQ